MSEHDTDALEPGLEALFKAQAQSLNADPFTTQLDEVIERFERMRRYRRWSVLILCNLLVAVLVIANAPILEQLNVAFAEIISAPLFQIRNPTVSEFAAPYNTIGTALIIFAILVRMFARRLFV